MKDLFSIGEISKLFNINRKTLRYYDEINLFKPRFVDETSGYRYYSTDQFEQLNTINYLKVLGMPLKDIKSHLDKRNIEYILELFDKQNQITIEKIAQLNEVKTKIENRMNFLKDLKHMKTEEIIEKELGERKVIFLKKNIKNSNDIELSIRELENLTDNSGSVFIGKIGVSVKMENLKNGIYEHYDELFMLIESEKYEKEHLKNFPQGKYISVTFKGTHDKSSLYYKKLLDYATSKNYIITGDSFERTLVDFALTNNPEEYLTEIQIPVKNS